ncbi:MAG TPA: hypothetical protein PLW48_06050, partial [Alphaproteobacteria bacterium]|nr:hypothetical protein [Alphaproteobacteria bacterium]
KGSLKNPTAAEKVEEPTLQPDGKKPEDAAGKDATKPAAKDAKAEADKNDDYQLIRAIDVLQGISLYRSAGSAPAPAPQQPAPTTP